MIFKFNPITEKRLKIFLKNKLAVCSLVVLLVILIASIFAPLVASDRPYVMMYNGKIYFPILKAPTAMDLSLSDKFKVDYRSIDWKNENWAVFPPIRFNPYESNESVSNYPSPPTWQNPFGTDDRGRDVFSRLLYGFRYSFIYAVGVWISTFFAGSILGLLMGFLGGFIDLLGQRLVEILSSVPQFFLLIILISVFDPSLVLLVGITSVFGWISISYYMRAEALKIRKLEYIEGARALGLPFYKIILKHVLPNALTPIITFSPFAIAAGVTGLAALDYLGFGLAPPTPSWGELLNQAKKYFTTSWWLAFFPSLALFGTLTLLNFVGEGLRNAFDPRQ